MHLNTDMTLVKNVHISKSAIMVKINAFLFSEVENKSLLSNDNLSG